MIFDHEVNIPAQVFTNAPQPQQELGFAGMSSTEEVKQPVQKKDFDILAQVIGEQKLDDIFSMVWFKDW